MKELNNLFVFTAAYLMLAAHSSNGQSVERLDDMNAVLGEAFTMTCPEGRDPYRWFKGESTDANDQVALVIPSVSIAECQGDFAERDCQINAQNGDLTLGTVTINDEGPYVCKKSFGDTENDSLYRLRYLNVNVAPTDVNMKELKFPKDGEEFKVECTVDRIRPKNATIFFKFTDSTEKFEGNTHSEPNGDGTFKLTTTLWKTFVRSDDQRRLRCAIQPAEGRGLKVTKDRRIYMHWEYKTEVQETDENEHPIKGQSKSLTCYNSAENEGKPTAGRHDVRWLHNGKPIQGDTRHEGASTRELTIKQLQKSDNGEYRCLIRNTAGPGDSLSGYNLQVWYPFKSVAREKHPKEIPFVGSDKTLTCYPQESGFPGTATGARWFKNGMRIGESDKYQIVRTYDLIVKNLAKSGDSGEYSCRIVNGAGEGASVQSYELKVFWAPTGQPEIQPPTSTVGIKSDATLTCNTDHIDEGSPPVSYNVWTKDNDELFHRNVSGNRLLLSDFETVTDGGRFYCQAGNIFGTSSQSEAATITVEAPVYIEDFRPQRTQTVLYDDTDFVMSCTASGSTINQVTWYKNGQLLDENYFMIEKFTVDGNFEYEQRTAVTSESRRKTEGHDFDCESVDYYSGKYKCKVEGSMAGAPSSVESPDMRVKTTYPALWAGRDKLVSASRDDERKTILCNVCAEPAVDSFTWEFNGKSLRSGIERSGDSITINKVESSDFGIYTCTAESFINRQTVTRTFEIELTEKGKPYEPKDFEVTRQTSTSATVRWKAGFAAGYEPQTFRLEYKQSGEADFGVFKVKIPENDGWITETIIPLAPSSEYDIRLQAFNQRPEMPNFSEYVFKKIKTRARPEIKLTQVEVKETKIQVKWKFGSNGRRKRATEDDGYSVGVQIKYKKESDKEYSIHPSDGSKIPAEEESAVINGTFDVYESYPVKLVIFENDLQEETASTASMKSEPLPKPAQASSMAGIIGGVVAVVVIIIIAVVIFIMIKKRQHTNKTKGARNFELGSKAYQRSSAGYSPLANNKAPYSYTSGPGQVNGEKPYMNMDEVTQNTYDDHSSPGDNLYDSVDDPPMRKCPAGPPPPEPLYAQPIKKERKKKKDKKEKDAQSPDAKENSNANAKNGAVTENPYQNVNYSQEEQQEGLYDDVASPQYEGSQEDLTNNGEELVYADLDMKRDSGKPKKKKKPVVIQNEPPTDYAVIDFGKKAPPAANDEEC